MTPFDPSQSSVMPFLTSLAGDQSQVQGPFPPQQTPAQATFSDVQDDAKKNLLEREPKLKKIMEELDKQRIELGELSPSPSKVDSAIQQMKDMMDPQSQYNQDRQAKISTLSQQLSQPVSVPDNLRDRGQYINDRIQQSYTGHGKLGMAAQFLQDLLRKPGSPSGREAVYKMASEEYDKAVKDALEKAQADRNNAKSQLDLLSQQHRDHQSDVMGMLQIGKLEETKRDANLRAINNAANLALGSAKFEEFAKTQDAKQMLDAFHAQYGNTPEDEVLKAMIQDKMRQGMSYGRAATEVKWQLGLIQGLTKLYQTGSVSTKEVNPSTLQESNVVHKTFGINPLFQNVAQLFGGATPPFLPQAQGQAAGQAPSAPAQAKPVQNTQSNVQSLVKQLWDNPNLVDSPGVKKLPYLAHVALEQEWTKETGLPFPQNLSAQDKNIESNSRIALTHIDAIRQLLKDPDIKNAIGPIAGRLGTLEQQIGQQLPGVRDISGLHTVQEKEQELRTRLLYLIAQETKALSSGRPAIRLMDEIKEVSANPNMAMDRLQGALNGSAGSARAQIKAIDKTRFGGKTREEGHAPYSQKPSGGVEIIRDKNGKLVFKDAQ